MKHVLLLRLFRRALLLIIFLVSLSTQILGQTYWDKVPALTSQCYYENDEFDKMIDDLRSEIQKKIEFIKHAESEKANSMTQEEKMAVAMKFQNMEPAEIVKFQAEMTEITTAQADFHEKFTEIESRYNQLESEFRAEFQKRLGPIEEEYRNLPDGKGVSQSDIEKGEALMAMYDKEYESICHTFLTSSDAKFRSWLKEFHKFLIEEEVPFNEKMMQMEYAQFGLAPDFSVVSLSAVDRYLEKSSLIFSLRRPYPQGG